MGAFMHTVISLSACVQHVCVCLYSQQTLIIVHLKCEEFISIQGSVVLYVCVREREKERSNSPSLNEPRNNLVQINIRLDFETGDIK